MVFRRNSTDILRLVIKAVVQKLGLQQCYIYIYCFSTNASFHTCHDAQQKQKKNRKQKIQPNIYRVIHTAFNSPMWLQVDAKIFCIQTMVAYNQFSWNEIFDNIFVHKVEIVNAEWLYSWRSLFDTALNALNTAIAIVDLTIQNAFVYEKYYPHLLNWIPESVQRALHHWKECRFEQR